MFCGEKAKTIDKEKLRTAKAMKEAEKTPEEIWAATGFFEGLDGRWRFEIKDFSDYIIDSRLRRNEGHCLLGLLYKNRALYAAYPTLKSVPVAFGGHNFTEDKIGKDVAGKCDGAAIAIRPNLPAEIARYALLHEVQHLVQIEEGFDHGLNYSSGKYSYDEYEKNIGEREALETTRRFDLGNYDELPYLKEDDHGTL